MENSFAKNTFELNSICSNMDEFHQYWNSSDKKLDDLREHNKNLKSYLSSLTSSVAALKVQASKLDDEINEWKQREYEVSKNMDKYSQLIHQTKEEMEHKKTITYNEEYDVDSLVECFEEECQIMVSSLNNLQSENTNEAEICRLEEEILSLEERNREKKEEKFKQLPFQEIESLITSLNVN